VTSRERRGGVDVITTKHALMGDGKEMGSREWGGTKQGGREEDGRRMGGGRKHVARLSERPSGSPS
jgi:hypothetical protein